MTLHTPWRRHIPPGNLPLAKALAEPDPDAGLSERTDPPDPSIADPAIDLLAHLGGDYPAHRRMWGRA